MLLERPQWAVVSKTGSSNGPAEKKRAVAEKEQLNTLLEGGSGNMKQILALFSAHEREDFARFD